MGERAKLVGARTQLSVVEFGKPDSTQIIVFLAGFPDNETSAWGDVLRHMTEDVRYRDHRFICMCQPDFEDAPETAVKPWGYSFDEILDLFHATIERRVPDAALKITLCVHDWGSIIGLLYENKYPHRIERLICFDIGIGIMHGRQPICMVYIIFVLYQVWWSFGYLVSQCCCYRLGDCIFKSYGALVPNCCQPTALDILPRKAEDVDVHMCYIYYHFWKTFFCHRSQLPVPAHPSCPILYLYGTNKNAMFHSQEFLDRIDGTPDSKQVAVNAAHWMTYGEPAIHVNREIDAFLELDSLGTNEVLVN